MSGLTCKARLQLLRASLEQAHAARLRAAEERLAEVTRERDEARVEGTKRMIAELDKNRALCARVVLLEGLLEQGRARPTCMNTCRLTLQGADWCAGCRAAMKGTP